MTEHKKQYLEYLQSPAWMEKTRQVYERDSYTCVVCKQVAEHVHHLTYEHLFNEPLTDLISVCSHCHKILHHC